MAAHLMMTHVLLKIVKKCLGKLINFLDVSENGHDFLRTEHFRPSSSLFQISLFISETQAAYKKPT
jgi:hypothetical protein